MNLSPIVIFCYNRPLLLKQTIGALQNNLLASDSDLIIFCDGPKQDASQENLLEISLVREYCESISGFKNKTIIKSEVNNGLQHSIINGLNKVFKGYDTAIIIEDDVVTSPYFLDFMNKALNFYEKKLKVLSIGSWNYYYSTNENFFNHMPDTIAWATWKDRWRQFEQDGKKLHDLLESQSLMQKFNLNGNFDFKNMLKQQYEGKVSSWAIRWTALAVLQDTLTLYPKISLSKHIGFGKDSTNCEDDDFNANLILADECLAQFDIEIKEDRRSIEKFIEFEKIIKNSPASKIEDVKSIKLSIKKTLKKIIPYRLKFFVKKNILKTDDTQTHGWFGNYSSWQTAMRECGGYDAGNILNKVKDSVLKVRNGEAVYERDSVLFDNIQYSQSLINSFKKSISDNQLHVVDFGGSLGSTYFQHKELFKDIKDLKWSVVEQKHFVDCGKRDIEIEALKFYYTIDEALLTQRPHVLLLSSVIPYFEKERITKQIVPSFIYKASYPAWFLSEAKFIDAFLKKYELIDEFKSPFDADSVLEDGVQVYRKGFYFKRLC